MKSIISVLKLLKNIDAFRKPDRYQQFILACESDACGRKGFEEKLYPQAEVLRSAFNAANKVDAKSLVESGLVGKEIADKLSELQIDAIKSELSRLK